MPGCRQPGPHGRPSTSCRAHASRTRSCSAVRLWSIIGGASGRGSRRRGGRSVRLASAGSRQSSRRSGGSVSGGSGRDRGHRAGVGDVEQFGGAALGVLRSAVGGGYRRMARQLLHRGDVGTGAAHRRRSAADRAARTGARGNWQRGTAIASSRTASPTTPPTLHA